MFSKILIANRGEIACRVIKTCRQLGVKTVAVYSDADANARHVEMADEAVHIGGAKVSESYLVGERIIVAALSTGAEAIHPGYGFLSENPDFVEAVEAAGLVFIGPTANAIRAMGLKDAAKKLMEEASVPVVPGYHGEGQAIEVLAGAASEIGYPVLIKARAGGGGKGMRKVDRVGDFEAALESCQREAQASFGDAHVLIEKYITKPRHIEVQVFGDSHDNVVHLFERDCSLQRRHQKVIEEAPAPDMPDDVRAAMTDAAVRAARAINYEGAGTIEFIVDGSGPLKADGFWFMEMNTRLQVEHPVTEAITGVDLVEWQLRVASGEKLPLAQEGLSITGHAFEARLYAEDATKDFLPATGTIHHLHAPEGLARFDSGVSEGDTISPFYDPMISKIITHGTTRREALARLTNALQATRVVGTVTNLRFLEALTTHAEFAVGEVDTGLIARDLDILTAPDLLDLELVALGALFEAGAFQRSSPVGAWQHWGNPNRIVRLLVNDEPWEFRATKIDDTIWQIQCCDDLVEINIVQEKQANSIAPEFKVELGGIRRDVVFVEHGLGFSVFAKGKSISLWRLDPFAVASDSGAGVDLLVSPMPGAVLDIAVTVGDEVEQGAPLVTLEAMKMEHRLTAPRAGVIADVCCEVGKQVSDGEALIVFESDTND